GAYAAGPRDAGAPEHLRDRRALPGLPGPRPHAPEPVRAPGARRATGGAGRPAGLPGVLRQPLPAGLRRPGLPRRDRARGRGSHDRRRAGGGVAPRARLRPGRRYRPRAPCREPPHVSALPRSPAGTAPTAGVSPRRVWLVLSVALVAVSLAAIYI